MYKNKLLLTFFFFSVFVQAQTSISLNKIEDYPNHIVSFINSGTYESMDVKVVNNYSDYRKIKVECGTVFRNHTNSEQSLVVLFRDELTINGGGQQTIKLVTACMDAAKSASFLGVEIGLWITIKGIGRLIEYYHSFRPAICFAYWAQNIMLPKDKQTTFPSNGCMDVLQV